MVPKKKLKTYAGPNKSLVNSSVDVLNNLLAKNISRRIIGHKKKKRKTYIKELPQRVARTLLADDSFHISTEDTFDKLLKATHGVGRRSISKNSNEPLRSPVLTRSKSRSASQNGSALFQSLDPSEILDSKSSSKLCLKSFQQTSNKAFGSSYWTRSTSRGASQIGYTSQKSSSGSDTKSSSNLVLKRFQQTTADPVYESIEVEVESVRKSVHSPISYIKVPEFHSSKANNVSGDTTFQHSFLKSFKDHPMANSTPFIPNRRKTIVQKNAPRASEDDELLQKSLKEIKSWDEKMPDFTKPSSKIFKKSRSSLDEMPDFHGFNHSEPRPNVQRQSESSTRGQYKYSHTAPLNCWTKSLVVSLDEFDQFQSKNNSISNFQNSSAIEYLHSMSDNKHNEYNDFVTKRRRIVKSVSAMEDSLLSRECQVIVEKCDQTYKNEQSRNNSQFNHSHSFDSFCSNISDKQFEDFFDKNHQHIVKQFGKNTRELVVNVTKHDLSHNLLPTNTAMSEECSTEHDTSKSDKSVIESKGSDKVDLSKELRIIVAKQDFPMKDLVVNLTLNEFDINPSTDSSTETEPECEVKELRVNLTFNDFKMEAGNTEDLHKSVDVSCQTSIQETTGPEVNTGTSCNRNSQIIDLTDSFQSVSKTDYIYSKMTDLRTRNDICITRDDNDTTLEKMTNDYVKDGASKTFDQIENSLKHCITPDMFEDSMHLGEPSLGANDEALEGLRNTLKECNMLNGSVNLIDSSLVEMPSLERNVFKVPEPITRKPVMLKSGKHWRRSLSIYKNTSLILHDAHQDSSISGVSSDTVTTTNSMIPEANRVSVRIVPTKSSVISRKTSALTDYASGYVPTEAEQQRDSQLREENLENSFRSISIREATLLQHHQPVTAREIVLSRCQQTEPWKFSDCYPDSVLQHCQKIGEGVYGEVFLFRNPKGGTSVMKIIPIEGSLMVNGERQKKYEEILSEIVISMELSNLRKNIVNSTSGYTELQEVKCVQGCYPERLLDLWHLYDETKGSENDCPDSFMDDQLYIILQLADAGKDLESFVFANAQQAMAMFKQVAFSLAVAEEELHFEHRDLHWGNVLLKPVDKNTKVRFTLNGNVYIVPTKGIQTTIIDFTLSRVEYDGVVIFNDLSLDQDLFTAKGDYQFDIYRLMQKKNGNNWQNFVPYTNLLWLHYILDKSITLLRYKNTGRKLHKEYIIKLKELEEAVLNYRSVKDFVLQCLT